MSEYIWILPSAPDPGPAPSSSGGPTGGVGRSNGALSLVLDPITRDLIDTADGWFLESTDSRTAVLFQLEGEYLAWWGDPFSGSRIAAILRGDDPATSAELRDEVLRCLQPLATEGIISELGVTLDVDDNGRKVLLLNYSDRASGRLVDLAYVPFGG